MPFLAYRLKKMPDLSTRMQLKQDVSLAGKSGPFAACVRQAGEREEALTWELGEDQLLEALGHTPAEEHALVVDLKPNVENNISLYRLRRVWGYSYPSWTALALQLETLFVDEEAPNPEAFKREFKVPDKPGDLVHEFLYLQAGTDGGRWAWGQVGSVNGCLLWPDAFSHFVRCIQPYVGSRRTFAGNSNQALPPS